MPMDLCHVWLGLFASREEVDDYFEEIVPYPEDEPISLFAEDQGKRFYDHDFVSAEFHPDGDLNALLDMYQVPADTRATVLELAAKLDFVCNTIVVADEEEFEAPLCVTNNPRLEYIGCFAFRDDLV